MIEKFSEEELELIMEDFRKAGYEIKQEDKYSKTAILREEVGADIRSIYDPDIIEGLYKIADRVTNNYEEKKRDSKRGKIIVTCRRNTVKPEIVYEYRKVLRAMIEALTPFKTK